MARLFMEGERKQVRERETESVGEFSRIVYKDGRDRKEQKTQQRSERDVTLLKFLICRDTGEARVGDGSD